MFCASTFLFKVSKKYVAREVSQEIHDKAAPFITWLKEADTEESESDEEESDDEVEIEYDDRAHIQLKATPQPKAKQPQPAVDDGPDDVDIDAI